MVTINVKKIHPSAVLPKKARDGDACEDIACCEDCIVWSGKVTMVRTGLVFEIPDGYMIEIRPRSGVSSRGILIPNSPCTIDSNYRGEVLIPMYGLFTTAQFLAGNRVAQMRVVKLEDARYEEADEVSEANRGLNGFGSTGL